jgi:hypothetical protein
MEWWGKEQQARYWLAAADLDRKRYEAHVAQRQPEGKIKDECRKIAVREALVFIQIEGKSTNGVPDTLCSTVSGSALILEFKVPGKEPTEQQWMRIYELRQAGINSWYATSVEEWEMLVGLRPSTIKFRYTERAKRAIGLA